MNKLSKRKRIALFFLVIQTAELLLPVKSFALMSGPSQPEVQSFEPISTTQTVDPFSGDFTYNIPLLEVDGYPLNISYHSGYGMEDEASWVGTGWNINPGCINRSVRGIPDDFAGDEIGKKVHIEPEKNIGVYTGITFAPEVFGKQIRELQLSVGTTLGFNFNNYKGVSASLDMDLSAKVPYVSVGLGFGVNSQEGADVNGSVGFNTTKSLQNQENGEFSLNVGTGFNTRTGLKNITYGISHTNSAYVHKSVGTGISRSSYIPIGLQNYVSVITNASHVEGKSFQAKIGGEVYGGYMSFMGRAEFSKMTVDEDGSRKSFGYLYSDAAKDEDILDFSREKDGIYNATLSFMPVSSMTYDVYSVTGQGTGGMFRPFRNDIGSVYDPKVVPQPSTTHSIQTEYGWGGSFELGFDYTKTKVDVQSGPWTKFPFAPRFAGSLYENTYFKQAGELTKGNVNYNTIYGSDEALYLRGGYMTLSKNHSSIGVHNQFINNIAVNTPAAQVRTPRATHIKTFTNAEAGISEVSSNKTIDNTYIGQTPTKYSRPLTPVSAAYNAKKSHHIGEIVQTQADGRRYVYGIPAMNNATREVVFSVAKGNADFNNGVVSYDNTDASMGNQKGRERYYSHTITPAYAHSYLLTGVLSDDYSDLTGDGITNDDLGSFTKLSYKRWASDYRWKSPYVDADLTGNNNDDGERKAQYNPGFLSDNGDDKGQYLIGSKELWHVSAIEGRNHIAVFYTSPREDGIGAKGKVLDNDPIVTNLSDRRSFKLDSIALFVKSDYMLRSTSAVPLKTVIFDYSYDLCPNTPNSTASNKGKLTLKQIYTRHGRSGKSLLSPYKFDYNLPGGSNNYPYSFAFKNRWGGYKPQPAGMSNWEFPYIDQADPDNNKYASAWQLSKITLPSGGIMKIEYESDDYAYVQDKRAMQMLKIAGVGAVPTYQPLDRLYDDIDRPFQYVYFARQNAKEKVSLTPKQNYLQDQEYLYYSFAVDLPNSKKYEHIKGYAKVEDVGYCNAQYGWIKIKTEKAGKKSDKKLHPATLMALNTGRHYIPHVLYPGFKNWDPNGTASNSPDPQEIMKAFLYSAGELLTIAKNPNVRFVSQSKAKYIDVSKSYIRLHIPGLTKVGGGSRVKKVTVDDVWNAMTPAGETSSYGQEFNYTMEDGVWGTVSSGVASYEPFIGGDENPLRQPVPYTADGGRLLPPIEFFQELPVAESLYPPASVGYSQVTTKSIHFNQGQSTQNINVTEYYTAREFPVVLDYTKIAQPVRTRVSKLLTRHEEINAYQGYLLKLNDMHGKLKSTANYISKSATSDGLEPITTTRYHYNRDASGALSNTVKAVVWKGGVNGQYYTVEDCKVGQEADVTVDSREHKQKTTVNQVRPNLNVFNIGPWTIPIPTFFFPIRNDDRIFRSMVTTRVVQQYGILKAVETIDHGARTMVENVLYDSETGNVLLTRTNNEFDDNLNNLVLPAYRDVNNTGMGPAYQNTDYYEYIDSMRVDSDLNGLLYTSNMDRFNTGDELLLEFNNSGDNTNYNYPGTDQKKVRLWVVGKTTVIDNEGNYKLRPTCGCTIRQDPCPAGYIGINGYEAIETTPANPVPKVVWMVVPRSKLVVGTGIPWIDTAATIVSKSTAGMPVEPPTGDCQGMPTNPPATINVREKRNRSNIKVTVIRSGKHNQIAAPLAQLAFHTTSNVAVYIGGYQDLLSSSQLYGSALTASAFSYGQSLSFLGMVSNSYLFNDFVLNRRGVYRSKEQFDVQKDRSYPTPAHTRVSGRFSLTPFLTDMGTGNLSMNLAPSAGWRVLKSQLKYSPYGALLEERDNNNVLSAAQLGYNNSLVTAVGYNTSQDDFMFEGFEDITMPRSVVADNASLSELTPKSPLSSLFSNSGGTNSVPVSNEPMKTRLVSGSGFTQGDNAHTGLRSVQATGSPSIITLYPLQTNSSGPLNPANTVYPFHMKANQEYRITLWSRSSSPGEVRVINPSGNLTINTPLVAISPAIDGWIRYEAVITYYGSIPAQLRINNGVFIDDIRIMPKKANMKAFVYDPFTLRLVATLDENHYATFYEYDQEGQLIRTKKETERGIITLQENRSSNKKM